MDGLEYSILTDKGWKKVVVNVLNVVYDAPVSIGRASSDWDAMGTLEIDWEIVDEDGSIEYDIEHLENLIHADICERILNKTKHY